MIPPLHEDLDFNAPLSSAHADRLLDRLAPLTTVVDLGCGWGELLLRAAARGATVHGVDQDAEAIAHARAQAASRGLSATFEVGDAAQWTGTADVLIASGSTHIWPGTAAALTATHRLLKPGARLLIGEGFWRQEPTEAQLAAMPMQRDEYTSLAALVDLAHTTGYRLLHLSEATQDEWDDFQCRHALGWERWLHANPHHPEAPTIRTRADAHRHGWLHGWRGVLGMAYLVLQRQDD
ncbi:class I SAM-dependent methyltransferase [Actinokineospora soli]|uniref:Class I SAM-dependent methyltransferase n=1 Tax=Actinokineospora soli TaxID=1048753 RepID=A0ABW2TWD6_9PSEU